MIFEVMIVDDFENAHSLLASIAAFDLLCAGPCGISPRPSAQTTLKAGMILSNGQ